MALSRLFLLILIASAPLMAQPQPLLLDTYPTGRGPQGLDTVIMLEGSFQVSRSLVAVANSGEDSVSVLELKYEDTSRLYRLNPVSKVTGIPRPYAVAGCGPSTGKFLITSPTSKSAVFLDAVAGRVLGTIAFDSEPYAVACSGNKAAVSLADNSLAIVDLGTLTVTARVQNVSTSLGVHGVAYGLNGIYVAGSNVVTVVDPATNSVLRQLAVISPTATYCCVEPMHHTYGVAVASRSDPSVQVFGRDYTVIASYRLGPVVDLAASRLGYGVVTDTGSVLIGADNPQTVPDLFGAAIVSWYSTDIVLFGRLLNPPAVVVTSPATNSVILVQARPGPPQEFAVTSATFDTNTAAPGGLATAFGMTGLSNPVQATSLPLGTNLGGVTLRIGGTYTYQNRVWVYSPEGSVLAPLLYADNQQVNFQVPPGLTSGDAVPVELARSDGGRLHTTMKISAVAPAVFRSPLPAILNQDNSRNGAFIPGARPANQGEVIQVFATGGGVTQPSLPPGEAAPASGMPLVTTVQQPVVTIGGKNTEVLFSGLAPGFVGVWQINVRVPAEPAVQAIGCGSTETQPYVCYNFSNLIITSAGLSTTIAIPIR